jgi:hypothetical protein
LIWELQKSQLTCRQDSQSPRTGFSPASVFFLDLNRVVLTGNSRAHNRTLGNLKSVEVGGAISRYPLQPLLPSMTHVGFMVQLHLPRWKLQSRHRSCHEIALAISNEDWTTPRFLDQQSRALVSRRMLTTSGAGRKGGIG